MVKGLLDIRKVGSRSGSPRLFSRLFVTGGPGIVEASYSSLLF